MNAPDALLARYAAPGYRNYVLGLMFLVYVLTTVDRGIVNVLVEPLKRDLALSDSEVGLLIGPAFSFSFVFAGLPLGRLADRYCRRNIIAACMLAWSAMTAFCGIAQGFVQLLLARAAVGIGEAGGPPAAVSLISDLYAETLRTRAFAVFYAAAPVGVMVAFGGGAWVTGHYGWHTAFLAAAAPGVLLAAVIRVTVAEPARGQSDAAVRVPEVRESEVPSRRAALHFMLGQRSLLQLMTAIGLTLLVGTGVMAFFTSFLVRSHGLSLSASGGVVSLGYGLGALAGSSICATLANGLIRRNTRWHYRIPALAVFLGAAALSAALLARTVQLSCALFFVWAVLTVCIVVPSYAAFQSLVPVRTRATMASIQFILSAVVGGLGPLLVGILSDVTRPWAQAQSLRYALLALGLMYLWACAHFALAGRSLKVDLERARLAG